MRHWTACLYVADDKGRKKKKSKLNPSSPRVASNPEEICRQLDDQRTALLKSRRASRRRRELFVSPEKEKPTTSKQQESMSPSIAVSPSSSDNDDRTPVTSPSLLHDRLLVNCTPVVRIERANTDVDVNIMDSEEEEIEEEISDGCPEESSQPACARLRGVPPRSEKASDRQSDRVRAWGMIGVAEIRQEMGIPVSVFSQQGSSSRHLTRDTMAATLSPEAGQADRTSLLQVSEKTKSMLSAKLISANGLFTRRTVDTLHHSAENRSGSQGVEPFTVAESGGPTTSYMSDQHHRHGLVTSGTAAGSAWAASVQKSRYDAEPQNHQAGVPVSSGQQTSVGVGIRNTEAPGNSSDDDCEIVGIVPARYSVPVVAKAQPVPEQRGAASVGVTSSVYATQPASGNNLTSSPSPTPSAYAQFQLCRPRSTPHGRPSPALTAPVGHSQHSIAGSAAGAQSLSGSSQRQPLSATQTHPVPHTSTRAASSTQTPAFGLPTPQLSMWVPPFSQSLAGNRPVLPLPKTGVPPPPAALCSTADTSAPQPARLSTSTQPPGQPAASQATSIAVPVTGPTLGNMATSQPCQLQLFSLQPVQGSTAASQPGLGLVQGQPQPGGNPGQVIAVMASGNMPFIQWVPVTQCFPTSTQTVTSTVSVSQTPIATAPSQSYPVAVSTARPSQCGSMCAPLPPRTEPSGLPHQRPLGPQMHSEASIQQQHFSVPGTEQRLQPHGPSVHYNPVYPNPAESSPASVHYSPVYPNHVEPSSAPQCPSQPSAAGVVTVSQTLPSHPATSLHLVPLTYQQPAAPIQQSPAVVGTSHSGPVPVSLFSAGNRTPVGITHSKDVSGVGSGMPVPVAVFDRQTSSLTPVTVGPEGSSWQSRNPLTASGGAGGGSGSVTSHLPQMNSLLQAEGFCQMPETQTPVPATVQPSIPATTTWPRPPAPVHPQPPRRAASQHHSAQPVHTSVGGLVAVQTPVNVAEVRPLQQQATPSPNQPAASSNLQLATPSGIQPATSSNIQPGRLSNIQQEIPVTHTQSAAPSGIQPETSNIQPGRLYNIQQETLVTHTQSTTPSGIQPATSSNTQPGRLANIQQETFVTHTQSTTPSGIQPTTSSNTQPGRLYNIQQETLVTHTQSTTPSGIQPTTSSNTQPGRLYNIQQETLVTHTQSTTPSGIQPTTSSNTQPGRLYNIQQETLVTHTQSTTPSGIQPATSSNTQPGRLANIQQETHVTPANSMPQNQRLGTNLLSTLDRASPARAREMHVSPSPGGPQDRSAAVRDVQRVSPLPAAASGSDIDIQIVGSTPGPASRSQNRPAEENSLEWQDTGPMSAQPSTPSCSVHSPAGAGTVQQSRTAPVPPAGKQSLSCQSSEGDSSLAISRGKIWLATDPNQSQSDRDMVVLLSDSDDSDAEVTITGTFTGADGGSAKADQSVLQNRTTKRSSSGQPSSLSTPAVPRSSKLVPALDRPPCPVHGHFRLVQHPKPSVPATRNTDGSLSIDLTEEEQPPKKSRTEATALADSDSDVEIIGWVGHG